MKHQSRNLSFVELVLALRGRQSGRNTAAVQQIAHEPVVLGPVIVAAQRVVGTECAASPNFETTRCAEAHRATALRRFYTSPKQRQPVVPLSDAATMSVAVTSVGLWPEMWSTAEPP